MPLSFLFKTRRSKPKNNFQPSSNIRRRTSCSDKEKIKSSDLRIGMYVSELDKPWEETPFLMQGFYIRSESDIDQVIQHCDYVFVDVLKKQVIDTASKKVIKYERSTVQRLPDKNEWLAAENTYESAQSLTRSILDEVRLSGTIKEENVKNIVINCIDSILNNSHTLVWISQLSKKSASLENHAMSICVLSIAFGRYLGFERKKLENLGTAALLHDIGMLKLPDKLLQDIAFNHETLSPSQYEKVKKHTTLGRDILMANTAFMSAVDVAYTHHECHDGSGYPRGLKGSSIPDLAKIISIVDAYDSITNINSYKPVESSLEALKIIYNKKGTQFDPELTLAFIRFISIYPPGAIVQLKSGDICLVIDRNTNHKHLPRVLMLRNKHGEVIKPQMIDLQEYYKQPNGKQFTITKMHPPGSFGIDASEYIDSQNIL